MKRFWKIFTICALIIALAAPLIAKYLIKAADEEVSFWVAYAGIFLTFVTLILGQVISKRDTIPLLCVDDKYSGKSDITIYLAPNGDTDKINFSTQIHAFRIKNIGTHPALSLRLGQRFPKELGCLGSGDCINVKVILPHRDIPEAQSFDVTVPLTFESQNGISFTCGVRTVPNDQRGYVSKLVKYSG